jgi:hypothetical protein
MADVWSLKTSIQLAKWDTTGPVPWLPWPRFDQLGTSQVVSGDLDDLARNWCDRRSWCVGFMRDWDGEQDGPALGGVQWFNGIPVA